MRETAHGMKVLLVEDDELIRDSISMFFSGEGILLDAYVSGAEAVEALKQREYDIIITDNRLPDMNGLAFYNDLQSLCPRARKVLITGYGNMEKAFTTNIIKETLSMMVKKAQPVSARGDA